MNLKQANRMLHHAWVLRTQVKPRYFDMSTISDGPVSKAHPCGTAACAIGYMPLAFPEDVSMEVRDGEAWYPRMIKSGNYVNEQDFYGIGFDERCHLFGGSHERTPIQQAEVMEDFVRSKGYEVVDA